LVQLGESLPKNYARALQSECRHDRSDDDIRPAGARSEGADRREQHRQVAEHVVARTERR
jgi:hypothetical protein